MRRFLIILFSLFVCLQMPMAQRHTVKIKLMHTTDVHGCYFPYNFSKMETSSGSLMRVSAYVKELRKTYHRNLLLFDNGDILQGQPTSYYYNYIDTTSEHLCASIMNEMGYDVGNLGNHDVETSEKVFTRWSKSCHFPILCANCIVKKTGKPYFEPYRIFVRNGVRIAVLGMITSAIPCWLSQDVYPGLQFEDMETTAREWINNIKEKEKPDIIVGLFHSGIEAQLMAGQYHENASREVAEHVPGFDIVMAGHDHNQYCFYVKNIAGQSVLVLNPGKNAFNVSDIDVVVVKDRNNRLISKKISGRLTSMANTPVDNQLMTDFKAQYDTLYEFVNKKLGYLQEDLTTRNAFFGPSAFIDAIHTFQLDLTGADISFTAPFTFNAKIKKGVFSVGDLFNLYKYENKLEVMELTGLEVKNYLEESYCHWFNQMKGPNDPLLLLEADKNNHMQFKYPLFNFDSAAGIIYTVDVTKPKGQKIQILKMANGEPFFLNKTYHVVLNSYRGNGGGELLTVGAGIPVQQLKNRVVYISNQEIRFYLMKYIEKNGTSFFRPLNQWKVIPEEWVKNAMNRDSSLIFNDGH